MMPSNFLENLDPTTFGSMVTMDDVQCMAYCGGSSSGNDEHQRPADMTAEECFAIADDDFKPLQRQQLQLPIRRGSFASGPTVNSLFDDWSDSSPFDHQKYQQVLLDGDASGLQNFDVVGRGKKREIVEDHLEEKAAIRRQKRMLKNRESAARSRERKQKYITDLESLVRRLTEENARLRSEQNPHIITQTRCDMSIIKAPTDKAIGEETARKSLDEVYRREEELHFSGSSRRAKSL